jgi:hypothetical protein
MLHRSSGRNNFAFMNSNSKDQPITSQQRMSTDQAKMIQQQTRDAIKVASESDKATDNNNTNSKWYA